MRRTSTTTATTSVEESCSFCFLFWTRFPAEQLNQTLFGHAASYLQPLDGQPQHAGGQLGGLLEGEVAPVNDEDEAVHLQLRVFDHGLQRQQDGSQDVHKRVSEGNITRFSLFFEVKHGCFYTLLSLFSSVQPFRSIIPVFSVANALTDCKA